MVDLSTLQECETAVIHSLSGGQRFISRVSAMGFTPETTVTMLQNNSRGPVLVYLHDSQVALGRGEAEKIIIKKDDQ